MTVRSLFSFVTVLLLAGAAMRSTCDTLGDCSRPKSIYPGNLGMDNIAQVAVTPDGKELWAYGNPYIAIVDTTRPDFPVVGTVKLPGNQAVPVSQIIFSADGRHAYMTDGLQFCWQEPCTSYPGYFQQVLVIDTANQCVSAIIPLQPPYIVLGSLALSHDGTVLYISSLTSDLNSAGILRLDLRTQTFLGFIEVPGLTFLVPSPDGRYLYCTRASVTGMPGPGLLSVVDTRTFQITASVTVGRGPKAVAVTPDGGLACVTNLESGDVSVVNLSSMTVRRTIGLGVQPQGIVSTPDGRKMYVGTFRTLSDVHDTTVSVIDLQSNTLKTQFDVAGEPANVAMHPDGTRLFVSNGNANGTHPAAAHVIDAVKDIYLQPIVLRESALFAPTGIAATPDGKRLFVISEARGTLLTIDVPTRSLVREQPIRSRALKVSKDGKRLFVFSPHYPSNNQGKLLVLDTQSLAVLDSIDLGDTHTPTEWDSVVDRIVLNSREDTAYLTAGDPVQVIIADLVGRQVQARIPVGVQGGNVTSRGLALTPDDRRLFATDNTSRRIVVIDAAARSAIATIPVGNAPSEIEISGDGKTAYVMQQYSTEMMSIIDVQSLRVTREVYFGWQIDCVYDFFLSADGRTVFVPCFDPNWIMVFELQETDPSKQITAQPYSGLDPFNCAASADKRYLFVTNFSSDTISVFDMVSRKIVDTIPIGNAYADLAKVLSGNATQLPERAVTTAFGSMIVSGSGDVSCDRKVSAIDLIMLRLQPR